MTNATLLPKKPDASNRCGHCPACRAARHNLKQTLLRSDPPFGQTGRVLLYWEQIDRFLPCLSS